MPMVNRVRGILYCKEKTERIFLIQNFHFTWDFWSLQMVLIHKAKGPIYGGTDTSHKRSVVLIDCHKAGGSGTQATARDQYCNFKSLAGEQKTCSIHKKQFSCLANFL